MDILVLGGTIFLGRHFVETALERGHRVTLFNRGKHNQQLFPEVEKLVGDRDGYIDGLRDRRWDAVLDTSGNVPRIVEASADLLSSSVGQYTFVSSVSVYQEAGLTSIEETGPIRYLDDESVEEISGESYGALKALCEQAAERSMPGRVLNVRPGLIVGPNDPSDRFTYWPWRMARGGEILVPNRHTAPIQLIDVRDLAKWLIESIEANRTGLFNLTGPGTPLTLGLAMDTIYQAVGGKARLTWVDEDYLFENDVGGWIELPLWLGGNEYDALMRVSNERALETGLTFRPLEDTIVDTLAWAKTRSSDHQWRAGLDADREANLLQRWHDRGRTRADLPMKISF